MTGAQDDRQSITVADARAAVQASGLLEAIEGPQYLSPANVDWRPYFRPTDDAEHPEFARVVVTRQGQKPREVVISWDEYAEIIGDDDAANEREAEWNDTRARKPMSIFGAEAERHAYRVVFADVLATIEQRPAPVKHYIAGGTIASGAVVERDWHADLAAASTKAEVDALFEEARAAKALKDAGLHEAFTRRLREVLASPKRDDWAPVEGALADAADYVAAQTKRPAVPSPSAVAAKAKPLTVTPPRRPQGDRPQGQRRRSKSR